MKKIFCFFSAFFLVLAFAGCSKPQASETGMSLVEITNAIGQSQSRLPMLTQITSDDPGFITWLSDYYLLPADQVADGAICYAEGVEASEIAVLLLADDTDGEAVKEALSQYIQYRAGAFEGYAPEQAALAKAGLVVENGSYLAMLICPDPQTAKAAFFGCFGKEAERSETQPVPASTPSGSEENLAEHSDAGAKSIPESSSSAPQEELSEKEPVENIYHHDAVLLAWKTGDESALSEIDKNILSAARNTIQSKISDSMCSYEKELAIHDFITDWSRFDYGIFSRSASDGLAENSDTPYGLLIDRSAMCHGYSSTFQLFMDMLDIECITVFGVPGSNGVEHSWNMVKLDGEWYCVDCAWDDPIGGSPTHSYFNVTSDYLRRGSIHHWDDPTVPEATGTAYSYRSH